MIITYINTYWVCLKIWITIYFLLLQCYEKYFSQKRLITVMTDFSGNLFRPFFLYRHQHKTNSPGSTQLNNLVTVISALNTLSGYIKHESVPTHWKHMFEKARTPLFNSFRIWYKRQERDTCIEYSSRGKSAHGEDKT